jgi:hypothetical protein
VPCHHRLFGRAQDRVSVLGDDIRRKPSGGLAQVHRPSAGMKAEPYLLRSGDLCLKQPRGAMGEDVMMVGRGRAARERQGRQAGAGGHQLEVRVDVRPHRIEPAQPGEEVRLL